MVISLTFRSRKSGILVRGSFAAAKYRSVLIRRSLYSAATRRMPIMTRFLKVLADMERAEKLLPIEKVFRDHLNPFDYYSDEDFLIRFRFNKAGVHFIF